MVSKVSRRKVHWLGALTALVVIAMLVTACGGATPEPPAEATTPPKAEEPTATAKAEEPTATAKAEEPTATPKPEEPTPTTAPAEPEVSESQAPQWQEMVAAGELPPLA